MRLSNILLLALIVASVIFTGGCTVALVGAAAAGTVGYVRGDLESVLDEDVQDVYNASLEAMEDMQMSIISKQLDGLSASVISRTSEDKKVTIKISAAEEGLTKLSIRVGVFGNETQSRMIYDKIKANL